ncbi:glycosyltransferase family 2 protein [Prosthecodimorpha staleyi]|uniref:Glycosyltransferase family 2 protein n=1 Tax=Prosthecodimorpha staleyi TaxID=2840188 RepID=A0A947GIU6_9HYPH|nr:glycosyltransferase family 2 protein [Prosthecodimorpha staleyi]MBT9290314.1 glycosyltransferase family 2 protein [Prosthecodimorpha staleyi]
MARSQNHPGPQRTPEGVTVTLATCAKNEGRYLLEWIAHHEGLGFTEIVIYDNGSTDGSARTLAALDALGLVKYRHQPDRPEFGPQLWAFTDAVLQSRSDWIVFLDLDEFLLLDEHRSIGDFLATFPDTVAQVFFNWRTFGSSGRVKPGFGLVMERFQRAAPPEHPMNRLGKSATRRLAFHAVHVHAPFLSHGLSVHADGTPMVLEGVQGRPVDIRYGGGRVNHYVVKSRHEFEEKKRRGRGDFPDGDPRKDRNADLYFSGHDRNEVAVPLPPGVALRARLRIVRLAAGLVLARLIPSLRRRVAALLRRDGSGQLRRLPKDSLRHGLRDGALIRPPSAIKRPPLRRRKPGGAAALATATGNPKPPPAD